MAVSLSKGSNVSLSKEAGAAGLTSVIVGLGWDIRTTTGKDFDLDASAIVADASGKVLSDDEFVFYGHLANASGTVTHSGDNLTGKGEGDDEQITIDLASLPPEAEKVVIPVAIYDADARSQTFGQVNSAFIRVVNPADGSELARFDLTEDAAGQTAMVFGEVYRDKNASGEWKFKAVGQGYASGLLGISQDYGVNAVSA